MKLLQVRKDAAMQADIDAVCTHLGLNQSDAVRFLFRQAARQIMSEATPIPTKPNLPPIDDDDFSLDLSRL